MAEIAVLRTHIINYSKTREVYVAYRKAEYSKNFLAEHEADILLHKTTKKAFDELGLKKIPTVKSLQAEYAQPHDAIVRSKGAWGTSLNKHLEAIWIAKSIACQYVSKSYNRNSQKISNYKIKIHFRVNSIAFKKKKDYTNYEGKLTVWFLICQEVAKMDEAKMVLSYNKLWKMLIDRKLKKKDLQKMTHLSSSVIAKMGRDESVHLDTIVKICIALQCNISDIVELQRKEA